MTMDDDLYDLFLELLDASSDVEGSWEEGDLAGAVRWLSETATTIRGHLAAQVPEAPALPQATSEQSPQA